MGPVLRFPAVRRSLLLPARYLLVFVALTTVFAVVVLPARLGMEDGGLVAAVMGTLSDVLLPATLVTAIPVLFGIYRKPGVSAFSLALFLISVIGLGIGTSVVVGRLPAAEAPRPGIEAGRFHPGTAGATELPPATGLAGPGDDSAGASILLVPDSSSYVAYFPEQSPHIVAGTEVEVRPGGSQVIADGRSIVLRAATGPSAGEALASGALFRDLRAFRDLLADDPLSPGGLFVIAGFGLAVTGLWFFVRASRSMLVNLILSVLALRGLLWLASAVQDEVVTEIVAILAPASGGVDPDLIAAGLFAVVGAILLGGNALRRPLPRSRREAGNA